jgi:hypothetical protein
MRTTLLYLILLINITVYGQQSENEKTWQFGVAGGASIGNVSANNTSYEFKKKNGFRTGIIAKFNFNTNVAVGTEIEFERRGFSASVYNFGLQIIDANSYICWECSYISAVDYQSFYLTLPLFVEFQKKEGNFGFSLKAGLYYSLMLQSFQDGYEEMFIDTETGLPLVPYGFEPGRYRIIFTGRVKNVVNTYDAGVLLGVGLSYDMSPTLGLFIDAMVYMGMVGYFENPEMVVAQSKTTSFKAGIYYTLFSNIRMQRRNDAN